MNNTLDKLPPQKNGKLMDLESKEIMKETVNPLPLNKKQYLEGASFTILRQPNC